MTMPKETAKTRIDDWKAIAAHMGVCVKTAQTWARKHGMPVYVLFGVTWAFTEELGTWRQTHVRTYADHVREQDSKTAA